MASTMVKRADPALVASHLRVVLGRLVRRLRAEHTFPLSHGVVLGRLEREGPQSVSDLAAAERVRPQSMAQTIGELESERLVRRRPDPHDRRRALIELTSAGETVRAGERERREGWLATALAELSAEELGTLSDAVPLLERLAERS